MGAARGGGDVAGAGEEGTLVDGGGGAFDAEVYEGVSVKGREVRLWEAGLGGGRRWWWTYSDAGTEGAGTGAGLGIAWVREMRRVVVVRKVVRKVVRDSIVID